MTLVTRDVDFNDEFLDEIDLNENFWASTVYELQVIEKKKIFSWTTFETVELTKLYFSNFILWTIPYTHN